ncbi:MAG: hypothetical protein Q7K43_01105 [Candidatus Woesearchaeota archaeon]|nr:hypothetical protein [Candidatus Woesearchaeota archaeon]
MPTYDYLCPKCNYLDRNVNFDSYREAKTARIRCPTPNCETKLNQLFPAPNLGKGRSVTETGIVVEQRQRPVFVAIRLPELYYEGPATLLEQRVKKDSRMN